MSDLWWPRELEEAAGTHSHSLTLTELMGLLGGIRGAICGRRTSNQFIRPTQGLNESSSKIKLVIDGEQMTAGGVGAGEVRGSRD